MLRCPRKSAHGGVPVPPSAIARASASPNRRPRGSRWRASPPKRPPPPPGGISFSGGLSSPATEAPAVPSPPGADLDLRGDELAGDRGAQRLVIGQREVAQLLEAGREVQRLRVEDGQLLLEAHGAVRPRREHLGDAKQVDHVR